MIVAIVSFRPQHPVSLKDATAMFEQTAAKSLGRAGLVRKHYFVTETGDRLGAIYVWKSKAAAEACYHDKWRQMATNKYGALPEIVYLQNPVIVENVLGRIEKP